MTDSVRWDLNEAVATITLNRPETRNALTAEMKTALLAALRQAQDTAEVRAVIITGAGPGFCAGQDLAEHAAILAASDVAGEAGDQAPGGEGDQAPGEAGARAPGEADAGAPGGRAAGEAPGRAATDTVRLHYNPIIMTIATMPKPVIAAVNGIAAGAGAALALACDFRIAARQASLLMAFARVGLGADSGASWTLQRLAGTGRATELLMLAEPLEAARALEYGLVTSVVDAAELPAAARGLAGRLAAGPTAAYAAIKEALCYAAGHGLAESLEKEAQLQAAAGRTADHRAATLAFTRKQQPRFEGR
jgi:2-(1,2-epoxy-1,2-dihydrophenyl)acetyl-CoA isomerase